MTDYEPNTVSVMAKDIKVGDIIVFCIGEVWHEHRVSSIFVNSAGWYAIRADNDCATFIYEPNERFSVVKP